MARQSAAGSPAASETAVPVGLLPERWTGRTIGARVLQGLSIGGAGFAVAAVVLLFRDGFKAGVDLQAYMRAGDALRAGALIYTTGVAEGLAFLYSPVWAVLFAAISWLPYRSGATRMDPSASAYTDRQRLAASRSASASSSATTTATDASQAASWTSQPGPPVLTRS